MTPYEKFHENKKYYGGVFTEVAEITAHNLGTERLIYDDSAYFIRHNEHMVVFRDIGDYCTEVYGDITDEISDIIDRNFVEV